ncbi:MAG: 2-hydroxyacid dehydrogenase [Firmicutes bacterium]|jgi:phosphoglycerate dehydrogenase-like enzyme|nr:2-hydroxyacid dehydrogenase [Bacillota bacterium]MCL5013251.1 2-hydroxyacid dehydrogenase [Bacillota bacterium]
MNFTVVLPPSERVAEQAGLLQQLLAGHRIAVVLTWEEQAQALRTTDILVSTAFVPVTREDILSAPQLKFIQVAGVGVDHVDLEAAAEKGIIVAAVAGANAESVAEHVIMSTLALLRPLIASHGNLKDGRWDLPSWMAQAQDLAGKTFGIYGMGRIGQELAKRLLPFRVTLLYHDLRPLPPDQERLRGLSFVSKEMLFQGSDIISLHLPFTPELYHTIGAKEFSAMKDGSILINTARAELVDPNALIVALRTKLLGAAIDVLESEPPPPDDPLLQMPNVLLTPHGAGVTLQAQNRIAQDAIQNVLRFLDNRPVDNVYVGGSS